MKVGLIVLWTLLLASGCGGGLGPVSPAQQELDQKHCTSNAECSSGLCKAGRCG